MLSNGSGAGHYAEVPFTHDGAPRAVQAAEGLSRPQYDPTPSEGLRLTTPLSVWV